MASTVDKVKDALHLNKDKSTTNTSNLDSSRNTNSGINAGATAGGAGYSGNGIDSRNNNTGGATDIGYTGNGVGASHSATGATSGGAGYNGNGFDSANNATGVTDAGYNGNSFDATNSATTGPASATAGAHQSNLLNKADPRIDSDLDGSRNLGAASHIGTTTNTGNTYSTPHAGHHGGVQSSANTAIGTGAGTGVTGNSGISSSTPGSGNAPNTAGPHNSDILNKLDPRVDSDVSGGKTYGGNKTYQ